MSPNDQQQPNPQEPPQPQVENEKSYGLTAGETQLLRSLQTLQQQMMSVALSHVAAARLSYPVTQRTQFKLNGEFTELQIGELVLPPNAGLPATQPPVAPQPPAGPAAKTSQGGQTASPSTPKQ